MTPHPSFAQKDVGAIVESVWSSFLLETPEPDAACSGEQGGAGQVVALVSVTGGWNGHVVLTCSEPQARAISAAMLEIPEAEVSAEDLADAVGEVANMIGGNVKSLLPDHSTLSMPVVAFGDPARLVTPEANRVCTVCMTWRGDPFAVGVWANGSTSTGEPA